jgi:hypothetical protein
MLATAEFESTLFRNSNRSVERGPSPAANVLAIECLWVPSAGWCQMSSLVLTTFRSRCRVGCRAADCPNYHRTRNSTRGCP